MNIAPVGFGNKQDRDLIVTAMEQTGLSVHLVDIKCSPKAGLYTWSHYALRNRYPDQYTWIPKLGNIHYADSTRDIEIANLEGGLLELRPILETHDLTFAMCGCSCDEPTMKHPHGCHRRIVVEAAAARWPDVTIIRPEQCVELLLAQGTVTNG